MQTKNTCVTFVLSLWTTVFKILDEKYEHINLVLEKFTDVSSINIS